MTIPHPFQIIAHVGDAAILVILMILTATIMFILDRIAKPLKTDAAPKGIISLELARDAEEVNQILNSWAANRKYAIFSVGFDYLFIVFYSITIALACVYAANVFVVHSPLWAKIGFALAWGVFLAGLLDVVENFALYKMLFDSPKEIWPKISRPCAQIKFLFALFLGPGYALIGLVFWLISTVIKNPG
jgi:hypothetical protein